MNFHRLSRNKKICLLLLLLQQVSILHCQLAILMKHKNQKEINMKAWESAVNRRTPDCRLPWSKLVDRLHYRSFRSMFRMDMNCFNSLCSKVESSVSVENFKSEEYLLLLKNKSTHDKKHNMLTANESTTGGYISGEIKLGITIRVLAGGSKYDIAALFDIHPRTVGKIFWFVLRNWIDNDEFYDLNTLNYLNDKARMDETSRSFSEKSNGILSGVIGVVDGWICKIGKPKFVLNPAGYFCRKGFFGLNLQVMCDHKRRVVWVSKLNIGSAHDSPAFKSSKLNKYLEDNWKELFLADQYILGDSTYPLQSYMEIPYDNVKVDSPEDHFNYYHSSSRIIIECVFGEFVARWALFNKRLNYNVTDCKTIIDSAFRLHNFLIDYREGQKNTMDTDEVEEANNRDLRVFLREAREEQILDRENSMRGSEWQEDSALQRVGRETAGRQTMNIEESKLLGKRKRDEHRGDFEREGMKRFK